MSDLSDKLMLVAVFVIFAIVIVLLVYLVGSLMGFWELHRTARECVLVPNH